jgi:hypothetical protein
VQKRGPLIRAVPARLEANRPEHLPPLPATPRVKMNRKDAGPPRLRIGPMAANELAPLIRE